MALLGQWFEYYHYLQDAKLHATSSGSLGLLFGWEAACWRRGAWGTCRVRLAFSRFCHEVKPGRVVAFHEKWTIEKHLAEDDFTDISVILFTSLYSIGIDFIHFICDCRRSSRSQSACLLHHPSRSHLQRRHQRRKLHHDPRVAHNAHNRKRCHRAAWLHQRRAKREKHGKMMQTGSFFWMRNGSGV